MLGRLRSLNSKVLHARRRSWIDSTPNNCPVVLAFEATGLSTLLALQGFIMLVIILLIALALWVDYGRFIPSKAEREQAKAAYDSEQARRAVINAQIEQGRREHRY